MAGANSVAPSYLQGGNCNTTDNLPQEFKSGWYFSREDIENYSPSRKDGILLQEEERLRNSYCSFLQDLGRKLGASQVMIATATLFCHRFYLHQSHAKNDWQTVATVCIFLASKVEDTPILVDKVITASYEMIHRRDEVALQKIRQKDVFSKQKELILLGERLVLSTIRFDFNIQHPYRPLIRAMNKFGLTQKAFRQMAWNYVNDWLRTTLCLQYKPHYIAAGTLFMTAKIQKVKLPLGRGYVWWHEFDVTPHQLDAVIREMMEFLGYKKKPVAAPKMPAQTPLPAKEEASSSPDSCVSSTPGSTHGALGNDVDGEVGKSKQVDIIEAVSSSCCNKDGEHDNVAARIGEPQCPARDLENPNGVVDDGEHFNVANHASAQRDCVPDCLGKVNLEKIKLLLKRRSVQKISNKTTYVDDNSEDAWLERELEAGIDLAVDSSKKKQRLS